MTSLSGQQIHIRQINADIQYSNDQIKWHTINAFPINIITDGAKVLFTTNLTLTANNHYFVCAAPNIQFGSTSTISTINIVDCINYPGFIQNGSSGNPGYNSIQIFNIVVNADETTELYWIDLAGEDDDQGGGYICQQWFGFHSSNNFIINCHSTGCIAKGCGGIVGANSQNLTIVGCSSSGDIGYNGKSSGVLGAGGIVGARCSYITIDQCFSTGTILGNHSGGIAGAYFRNGGKITNCYSGGAILGAGAGGIAGYGIDDTIINACYSTGQIKNNRSGGIVGAFANSVEVVNCFTTGDVLGEKQLNGGICGSHTAKNNICIKNCYTCGKVENGGYFNCPKIDVLVLENCLSEAKCGNQVSQWNVANAEKTLIMQAWLKNSDNAVFSLRTAGFCPYAEHNIIVVNGIPQLCKKSCLTLVAGGRTCPAIKQSGNNVFSLFETNMFYIDATTGEISTDATTPGGIYNVWVINRGEINESVTEVELTVLETPVLKTPFVQETVTPSLLEQSVTQTSVVQSLLEQPVAKAVVFSPVKETSTQKTVVKETSTQETSVAKSPITTTVKKSLPKTLYTPIDTTPVVNQPPPKRQNINMSYVQYSSPTSYLPVGVSVLPDADPITPMRPQNKQAKPYRT